MFMDNKLILNEGMLDYQVLITYFTENLDGIVGKEYSAVQGRIIIE